MKIILIAAFNNNRVIGMNGRIPWHHSDDLKRFKALTQGHVVVEGRKTFESIGKPFPNRRTLVISNSADFRPEGVEICSSLQDALQQAAGAEKVFIGGGQRLYEEAMPLATDMQLTLVHSDEEGDAYFPSWNDHEWVETHRESRPEFDWVDFSRQS